MNNKENYKESKVTVFETLDRSLCIMRYFTKRSTHKAIRNACLMRLPAQYSKNDFGNVKLPISPSYSEFFSAASFVSDFIMIEKVRNTTMAPLNSQRLHSATVMACMDTLFRCNKDVEKAMISFCEMIDEDDSNEKALSMRRTLLKNKRNADVIRNAR